jgi:hypothetical protein
MAGGRASHNQIKGYIVLASSFSMSLRSLISSDISEIGWRMVVSEGHTHQEPI